MPILYHTPTVFKQIYDEYFGTMFEFATYWLDIDQAGIAVQKAFMGLYFSNAVFKDKQALQSFLFRSNRNFCINAYNKAKRLRFEEINDTVEEEMNEALLDPDHYEVQAKKIQQLLEAVKRLSLKQREIIYLRYFENLTFERIAEIRGISYYAAKSLHSYALQKLRLKIKL